MKGSHPRPADRCPFVLRHSISQVTSFMQLDMLWDTAVVGNQQALPCGSSMVTTGEKPVVDGFLVIPHSIQIPQSWPSRPKHLWSDPVGPSRTKHGLDEMWSTEEPLWTCLAPKFQWQHASKDAVDGRTSQTHATSNSTLPHALMGKCKLFMPNTYRGWTGHY